MAKVQKTVITALGEQMLFSSALTYTDATLCSQDVSNLTTDQLRALTDLTGKVLSSPISAHKRQGNTKADQVDVQVTFTNRDQKTDINYSSIGWFARDRQGHETLIAVTPFIGTDTIAAAPPDGTATSSKNITLSMAVGTATEINVLIDPAGSVTPSTFNAEVDKINEALALKADNAELADYAKKADVNSALDAKADKTALDPLAKSEDVAKDVETLNSAINLKADKTDLAPLAKTEDVNTELDKKADKTALDDYAKSSDVRNQISANVDKLNQAINTKANSSDVYVRKDVDSAFSEVRDRIGKLEGSQTVDSPDFNNLTASGVYYITNNGANIKNNPVGQWGVLIVSNGDGHRISQVYYPDDGNPPWYRSLDESTWRPWYQLSTKSDVQNAVNLANASSNKVDTVLANSYFRKQGMDANGNCVEIRGNAIKQSNGGYAFDILPNDWTASKLKDVLGQLPSKANTTDVNNALNGKANTGDVSALQNKVNVNTPLFREISADSTWEDIFGVTNPNNVLTSLRINPGGNGQLVNDYAAGIGFGGNDTKAVISVDYGSHVARFTAGNGVSPVWSEDVAWKSDISSLTQALTKLQAAFDAQQTKIAALQATVNNQANQLTYFKQHYIEGKAFDADQIKQAMAWTGDDGQKLAIIRDKENEGGK